MISITKAQVPKYLVGSEFYESLSSDETEEFSISKDFLKLTPHIDSADDLSHLLHTMRFWGRHELPEELSHFLMLPHVKEDVVKIRVILSEFSDAYSLRGFYDDVQSAGSEAQKISAAAKTGRFEVVDTLLNSVNSRKAVNAVVMKGASESGSVAMLQYMASLMRASNKNPFSSVSLRKVAELGHTDSLRYLFESGCTKIQSICVTCAQFGQLECLKMARQYGCECDEKQVVIAAAAHGRIECLEYALGQGFKVPIEAACKAAQQGFYHCLQVLANHVQLNKRVFKAAAVGGHFAIVQYLCEHLCPWDAACAKAAAANGNLVLLTYMVEHGCPIDAEVANAAAAAGKCDCVRYLHTKDCKVSVGMVHNLATSGHLACLQFLHEEANHPFKNYETEAAAQNGHLHVLKYLFEQGCPCNERTTFSATDGDHIDCLRFAHEHGCPWDATATRAAARAENVELLQYLHEHGCPWDVSATIEAARYNFDCLKYAHQHGCPCDENTSRVAAWVGDYDALKYLHEEAHCPWTVATANAAVNWTSLPCLKYAVDHGCPCDETTCLAAVKNNDLEALKYLHEHGCPWDQQVSKTAATRSYSCLRYCVEHGCPVDRDTMDTYNRLVDS